MSLIPQDLKYTKTHEWIRQEDGNLVTIGITDYAQNEMGDIVYVELPEVGDSVSPDQSGGTIESVKAAEDLHIPVTGTVEEINTELEASPEDVNDDPYGKGWMIKLSLDNMEDLNSLLTSAEYAQEIGE